MRLTGTVVTGSGSLIASGVYILELTVNGHSQVRRMFVGN